MDARVLVAFVALMVVHAPGVSADPGTYHDSRTVAGPSGIAVQNIFHTAEFACLNTGMGLPFECDLAPGALSGISTTFDVREYADPNPGLLLRFWVEQVGGLHPSGVGGFAIYACSDRDDSLGGCTRNDPFNDDAGPQTQDPPPMHAPGDHDDHFSHVAYSNDAFIGPACEKDDKDCGDSFSAEVFFCAVPDTKFQDSLRRAARFPDGELDDVRLYITLWLGTSNLNKVGGGVSLGVYDVYMDVVSSDCDPDEVNAP